MRDKVSVCIPVYNGQETIWKCVRSVALQKYRPLEILIVDDGSNDNTANLIELLKKKYPEVRSIRQENRGISSARNSAIRNATGKWILFLDSDDTLARNSIEILTSVAMGNQSEVVIGSHTITRFGISKRVGVNKIERFTTRQLLKKLLQDTKIKNYVWGKLISRDLFEKIEFPEGKVFEDMSVMAEIMIKAKRVVAINNVVIHYNADNRESISHGLKPEILKDYLTAQKRQIESVLQYDLSLYKNCISAYRRVCLLVVVCCLFYGVTNLDIYHEAKRGLFSNYEKKYLTKMINL